MRHIHIISLIVLLLGGMGEAFAPQRAIQLRRDFGPLLAKRGSKGKAGVRSSTRSGGPPGRIVPELDFATVESDGSDAWRCSDVAQILLRGGCGVVPTETGYGFVTLLESREGLERILRIKGLEQCKKPLSLLCGDLSTIDKYCYGINRGVFKILKKNLPGAYTFILPASTSLPKMVFLDSKGGRHSWARKTLGVRISNDPVLRYLQDELLDGEPMLVTSLPINEDERGVVTSCGVDAADSSWCNGVDFIVDAGERPVDGSTIFDLSGPTDEVILVREGLGELELQ